MEDNNEIIKNQEINDKKEGKRAKLSYASPIDIEYFVDPYKYNSSNYDESNIEQNQILVISLRFDKPEIKTLLITKKLNKLLEDAEDQYQQVWNTNKNIIQLVTEWTKLKLIVGVYTKKNQQKKKNYHDIKDWIYSAKIINSKRTINFYIL